MPKGTSIDAKTPAGQEVYTDNKKQCQVLGANMPHSIYPNPQWYVFGQRDDLSLWTLCTLQKCLLLSMYWREACEIHENKKDAVGNTWQENAFALIMKEYKNWVLSGKYSVAVLKAFGGFMMTTRLNRNWWLRTRKKSCFLLCFSADHWNVFVRQQK